MLRTLALALVALAFIAPAHAQGGRLTLAPATPVMTADTTSGTLYYTPYAPGSGNSDLSLSLAGTAGNTLYDVFEGTGGLCLGPAWTDATHRFMPLQRSNGTLVNTENLSCATIGTGTYLGTILTDAAGGTVTVTASYGTARRWGVWNAYNRLETCLEEGEVGNALDYTSAYAYPTWGPEHSNSANNITILVGLAEEPIEVRAFQNVYSLAYYYGSGRNQGYTALAIGWNSTTVPLGIWAGLNAENFITSPNSFAVGGTLYTDHLVPPFAGYGVAYPLESDKSLGATARRVGGQDHNGNNELEAMMIACYRT